jgi:uncharacterized membrane protein/thiol-disulfide isomerase/thioredoxin
MKTILLALSMTLALLGLVAYPALAQQSEQPVVRAVLFYSPTCPHCHTVINETLIPMVERYGDRLQIVAVNIAEPNGQMLFQASTEKFQIPAELSGVPRLVVDETVLVGSLQIPERFPGIVEAGLAAGGIDWPPIAGLAEAMAAAEEAEANPAPTAMPAPVTETPLPTEVATPAATATPTVPALALSTEGLPPAEPGASTGLPEGGWLAAVLLGGMLLALGFAALRLLRPGLKAGGSAGRWLIPVLAIAGLGVAMYLAYVELTQSEAVCGPVGECNLVQTSPYAKVLGIPVAVLGLANYGAILVLWAVARFGSVRWNTLASRGLLVLTVVGVLFSIYLTVLELAVIHAVCAWCLTSALITTLLMLVVVLQLTTAEGTQRDASPQRPVHA